MKVDLVAWVLPVLLIIILVPLVIGIVPPNSWYGFRTPKTLGSPAIWYPANRAFGWFFIGATVLALCFSLALWRNHPEWPEVQLLFWMANADGIAVLVAIIPSLLYLRGL